MNARAHVVISGRVQGVYFRFETHDVALRHDVNGWVRNLRDGRVEAVFEGDKEEIKKVIEFCKNGSLGAKVTDIKVDWQEYKEEFNDFKILF